MATTTRKTQPRNSTSRASTTRSAKPAPEAAPEIAEELDTGPEVEEIAEDAEPAELRRGELIDRVVAQTGIRKKFAKPVIEEVLAILGEELAEGRRLSLQPMGRFKITRHEDLEKGRLIVARIRQTVREAEEDASDGEETLAEAAE